MEVMEKPPTVDDQIADELKRFKVVVAKRRFPSEFILLFEKLATSDMFSVRFRPHGFAYMVEQSAQKVPNHFVGKMLDALEESKAVSSMFDGRDEQARADLSPLVRRLIELTPMEPTPQLELFLRLERMGISKDRGDTICMALEAGAPEPFMDEVCDISFYEYYPSFTRPAPKPIVEATAALFAGADDI